MINIAICDDNKYTLYEIEKKLNNYNQKNNLDININTFCSGENLINSKYNNFDIIFLDINLSSQNDINGIDIAKFLRKKNFKGFIVFITVLKEFVFKAFEVKAFDYIIKPITENNINKVLNRILQEIKKEKNNNLLIQKNKEHILLNLNNIIYFEVINKKIYIHTNNKIIDYYNKINLLEKELNNSFFRCHRSYIINLKYIKSFKENYILLKNNDNIPLSKSKYKMFLKIIKEYIKDN